MAPNTRSLRDCESDPSKGSSASDSSSPNTVDDSDSDDLSSPFSTSIRSGGTYQMTSAASIPPPPRISSSGE